MGHANSRNLKEELQSSGRPSDHDDPHNRQHDGAGPSSRPGPMTYGGGESMLHSPPDSPGSVSRSPLIFTPQMPMVPTQGSGGGDLSFTSYHIDLYGQRDYGRNLLQPPPERGVPTMIVWSHGGNNVAVEGSWDNWASTQQMHKVGNDFTLVKMLPSGIYQYKIIVDEDWHYPEEVLSQVLNVLDVQDYVPDNLDSVAGFEPPRSPTSSYNDTYPSPEDFALDPPALPPHFQLTLLNVPPAEENLGWLPRPQRVTLNHLYAEKGGNVHSVLALGLTHRYRSKYVTVALYKPVHK